MLTFSANMQKTKVKAKIHTEALKTLSEKLRQHGVADGRAMV